MIQPGGRSFAFVSGMMIGILTALGVVFLVMNDLDPVSFKYRNPFSQTADTIVDKTIQAPHASQKLKKKPPANMAVELVHDSVNTSATDSVFSTISDDEPLNELVVKRDEMIASKSIELIRMNSKDPARQKNDSLIRQLMEAPPGEPARVNIEYWRSPVNFRGYRLIRNSLVLFGLNPEIPVSAQSTADAILLKYGSQTFRLTPTDTYQPLPKPITD